MFFILISEALLIFMILFYEDLFFKKFNVFKFWFSVFSGWVCYYSFGKSSVITETKNNEIIKEVFIGK